MGQSKIMSESGESPFDDSWQDMLWRYGLYILSYVATMFGFFIFGIILFVIPGVLINEFTSFIPYDIPASEFVIVNAVGSFVLGCIWRNSHHLRTHWIFNSLRDIPYVKQIISTVDTKMKRLDDEISEFHKQKSQVSFLSAFVLEFSKEDPVLYKQIIEKMGMNGTEIQYFGKINETMLNMQKDISELKSLMHHQDNSSNNSLTSSHFNIAASKSKEMHDLKNKFESLEFRFAKLESFTEEYVKCLKKTSGSDSFLRDSGTVATSDKFLPKDD